MEGFWYFPEGVWEEIMLWLPPESLSLLKCVCKPLNLLINSLVKDPKIVAKHHANMKKKLMSSEILYFRNLQTIRVPAQEEEGSRDRVKSFLTFANNDLFDWDCIPCADDTRELISPRYCSFFDFISQCDGIIFLCRFHVNRHVVMLMNPALKEIKILPDLCCYRDGQGIVAGFGYDSKANDYKVVIVYPTEDGGYGDYEAKVYSLRTDSWKEIEINVEIARFSFDRQVEYCNGVCYWYYCAGDMRMTCFDFGDEVFRHIPLPENAKLEPYDSWYEFAEWTRMAVWCDSLVLFFYPLDGPLRIDMWVLNSCSDGVGGSYSWTKHLTIKQPEEISWPLVFWGMDKLFMRIRDDEIVSYSLSSKEYCQNTVGFKGFYSDRFVICATSLVSLHSEKGREAQRKRLIHSSFDSLNPVDDKLDKLEVQK